MLKKLLWKDFLLVGYTSGNVILIDSIVVNS